MSNLSEEESLNRAIEESLKYANDNPIQNDNPVPIRIIPIQNDNPVPPVKHTQYVPKQTRSLEKPKEPSATPPMPGMTLKTTIKNGWVTKEWRMF